MKSRLKLNNLQLTAMAAALFVMFTPIFAQASVLDTVHIELPSVTLTQLDLDYDVESGVYVNDATETTCLLTSSADVVDYNGSVVLTWETAGFDTVTINGGVHSITNGSQTFTNLTQDTTYLLEATNHNGDTCTATVHISCLDPVVADVVEEEVVEETEVNQEEVETVDSETEETVTHVPVETTTDTTEESESETVTEAEVVTEQEIVEETEIEEVVTSSGGGGGSSSPRCELYVSDASINAGDTVDLEWDTRNATDITITDDNDTVIVTTTDLLSTDKRDLLDGTIAVAPTETTTYTLVSERGSRDDECEVEVSVSGSFTAAAPAPLTSASTVADEIVILQTRDSAPLAASISLSQVPYTGFEAGPVLTALFYIVLALWALYLTYVLVIPRKSNIAASVVANSSPATEADAIAAAQAEKAAALQATAAPAPAPVAPAVQSAAATVAAPANLPTGTGTPVAPVSTAAVKAPDVPVEVAALETIANNNQALLSSDAMKTFITTVPVQQQLDAIVTVVNTAKSQFPLEDGWVVINNDRMLSLLTA